MPKRYDTKIVRDTIGALDHAGVRVPEIMRRLNDGEAGLPYKVPIGRRQIYTYRAEYRAEHGVPHEDVQSATIESVSALEQRMIDLIAREIHALEKKKPGSLTAKQASSLNAQHRALISMERRAKQYQGKSNGRAAQNGDEDGDETVLQRLAREQREAVAA
jgi:hypothetical protein